MEEEEVGGINVAGFIGNQGSFSNRGGGNCYFWRTLGISDVYSKV